MNDAADDRRRRRIPCVLALALRLTLTACSSSDRERAEPDDLVLRNRGRSPRTPQLFTIPPDQMSHVQVVTVAAHRR